MIFKCNNCGGIMVYSPEKEAMYCEHCGSVDSQSVVTSENMTSCVNCGAPMEITDYREGKNIVGYSCQMEVTIV